MVFKKGRLAVYAAAFALLLLAIALSLGQSAIDTTRLANYSGFLSFSFISIALLITPIRKIFPQFGPNASLYYARRAVGVSAFGFALAHFALQFVFLFGMKVGLLGNALTGLAALAILFALGITSTDYAVRKMGRNWFRLQRLAYLAYPLIIIHAIQVGLDFRNANAFSVSFLAIAAITVAFEVARVAKTISAKAKSDAAGAGKEQPKAD